MVGHKSNVVPLKEELKKAGVKNIAETMFCQGHTTRWGLAWSFDPDVKNLQTLTQNLKPKEKEKPPMQYTVPMPKDLKNYNVTEVTEKLKMLFTELEIEYKQVKKSNQISVMEISARKNTWSHQRRKRRKEKMQTGGSPNKTDVSSEIVGTKRSVEEEESNDKKKIKLDTAEECGISSKDTESTAEKSVEEKELRDIKTDTSEESRASLKDTESTAEGNQQNNYFVKALISVKRIAVEVVISIILLEATHGRDGPHQILQYIKNNLKLPC